MITFEGCEGAGKSTQAQRIYQLLVKSRVPAVMTHEPGGTEVAEKIRTLLLDEDLSEPLGQRTELLLYFASRAQHIDSIIQPSLEKDKVVICDRFHDATVAYQGYGRKIDMDVIHFINGFAARGVEPDLTILIDIDVLKGIERSKNRSRSKLLKKELNRMEQESLDFHQRVREGYLALAQKDPGRIRVYDGELAQDALFEMIWKDISALLSARGYRV
jgi:dTMP kinase